MENMMTCLNFQMDRVVFFGYSDIMTREKISDTRKALKRICGMEEIDFIEVSRMDLKRNLEILKRTIEKEIKAGNQCFYDLTGGKDLVLVAMGMLSDQMFCPMHRFNMKTGELRVLNPREGKSIGECVPRRKISLTLDDVISIYGGMISYREQKEFKNKLKDEEFKKATQAMWKIAKNSQRKWNGLSSVFRGCTNYEDENRRVVVSTATLRTMIGSEFAPDKVENFFAYLQKLVPIGAIKGLSKVQGNIVFTYGNEALRDVLLDAGSLLEIMTYYHMTEKGNYSDARIGVHIDWDGVYTGADVKNEIDVMLLEDYRPVFISCKNGKADQMALYELHTVADRFAGKYGTKILMTSQELSEGHLLRAEELGIECVYSREISDAFTSGGR
ncbi:MAG: DUF1887 family protein [Agathobacter sp.]|nr:DUF1887 family protein [Agathobacter sp.]